MKERTYMISAVAQRFDIHPQTLRLYEREGLLIPSRTKGNTRVYTDRDLERLGFILVLSREMGVNLAGIEIILNMRRKMEIMQEQFSCFIDELKKEFKDKEHLFDEKRNAIVKFTSPLVAPFKEDNERD
ncbi:MAG TPA: MerR family transcriptional regulator [Candidatus Aminicenantes bacterium]|nr:MerR family transcriptional regulator [Candidatus Aminicenantes bacterium]